MTARRQHITSVLIDVLREIERADSLHPSYNSAHEGYAMIAEEVDELWEEVRKRDHDKLLMRLEAVQVATTAVRFIMDVCDKKKGAGIDGTEYKENELRLLYPEGSE